MRPIFKVCPARGCGKLTTGGRCPEHARTDHQRAHAKQRAHGRDTAHWRHLSALARRLQPWCSTCGATDHLTAHLRPSRRGDHRAATLDDVTVLCRTCHGTLDAPRACATTG